MGRLSVMARYGTDATPSSWITHGFVSSRKSGGSAGTTCTCSASTSTANATTRAAKAGSMAASAMCFIGAADKREAIGLRHGTKNIGRQLDPKDIENVEVSRGGYSAKYGDRTYGMVNIIIPKSGFEFNSRQFDLQRKAVSTVIATTTPAARS